MTNNIKTIVGKLILRKLNNPSASRNKQPILDVLTQVISTNSSGDKKLLEISSGTGQHARHFAPNFPNITFQPSEYDASMLPSIKAYIDDCPTKNICQPMHIDVSLPYPEWGTNPSTVGPFLKGDSHQPFSELTNFFDYMLNINMIHVSPFKCTLSLFKNASALLKVGGLLITYGAYAEDGVITPESNVEFNKLIQERDSEFGLRDLTELKKISLKEGIEFQKKYDMPANNKCIIWKKIR